MQGMDLEATKERIKEIKRLHEHRERAERGLFIIEGVRLMEEAVRERVHLDEVLCTAGLGETDRGRELLRKIKKLRVPVFRVSEKVLERVSETESPQGILAVARQIRWSLRDALKDKMPVIAACGLQDPGNLGTIIRTADAGGCGGVITTPDTVDIYNSKVVRAAMGSAFRLPVLRFDDPDGLVSLLKGEGYQVAAATSHSGVSYLEADYRKPTAFLIGREAAGLSEKLLRTADLRVYIPMREGVESLNAAVSASILVYEAFRQRQRLRGTC